MITDEKKQALKQFLSIPDEDMDNIKVTQWDKNTVEIYDKEYLVLTDMEADDRVKQDILNSLFAFRADFILQHCSTYDEMSTWEFDHAKEALEKIQGHFAEGINALVKALISDIDEFVKDAVNADGRGHFISHYDEYENEEEVNGVTYYIYRMN